MDSAPVQHTSCDPKPPAVLLLHCYGTVWLLQIIESTGFSGYGGIGKGESTTSSAAHRLFHRPFSPLFTSTLMPVPVPMPIPCLCLCLRRYHRQADRIGGRSERRGGGGGSRPGDSSWTRGRYPIHEFYTFHAFNHIYTNSTAFSECRFTLWRGLLH